MNGNNAADSNLCEIYDGSSWSETGDLNTGRYNIAGFGHTSTAAIVAGGQTEPPSVIRAFTEQWDGVTWTEVADMPTALRIRSGIGTSVAGLAAGGLPGSVTNTDEWTQAQNIKVIAD